MTQKKNDSTLRFLHVYRAIEEIEKYTKDVDLLEFENNEMLVSAVLFQFVVAGEAIRHIDDSVLSNHDYPWHKVRAFRNLIAHEYFHIKLVAVWGVIKNELPALKDVIS